MPMLNSQNPLNRSSGGLKTPPRLSFATPSPKPLSYEGLSAQIYDGIESVQFTITEVGSDLVPTETTFDVTHKGRRQRIKSKVDIFLTSEYAQARGFSVAALHSQGLIKERPGNEGQGQGQGQGDP